MMGHKIHLYGEICTPITPVTPSYLEHWHMPLMSLSIRYCYSGAVLEKYVVDNLCSSP